MAEPKTVFDNIASTVQVVSVVIGVYLSVLSFNQTKDKEADARRVEAETRRVEAERPFQELRRTVFLETVKTAAIIANPEGRSANELNKAKRRFRELYVAELSMVEPRDVESGMVHLAEAVDPELVHLKPAQQAALDLAHALGQSYVARPSR
ncbi:hypothetical protein [Paraburkholderia sp. BL17N1]|uniref:hypothetical protein n=1 Tax=Paraburkholderia sp. BL17N1 TaxID=1938798 RepID=UPI000EB00378|nr:hypothetical protein [Paraburkholderia sp. BL17N1]RKR31686.1 hypothetical protein B0G82_7921 [Paraburkholderia sp. BL17N1]